MHRQNFNLSKVYELVVQRLTKAGQHIPAELSNNIGCLHLHKGNYGEAQKCFEAALKTFESDVLSDIDSKDGTSNHLRTAVENHKDSVRYNLARCLEWSGDIDEATIIYQKLCNSDGAYIDG